jgi:thiamine thiazole synthase
MSENKVHFHPVQEKEVTRAIVREFATQFDDYADSDVVIVGAGPSGLLCGKLLAETGKKVLLVERNNYLGGGFWIGGYFMNKVTVREPAEQVLDEIGVPHKKVSPGLHVADGPHACSRLIAAACDAGVKFANLTCVEDVVIREDNRVHGAVLNWSTVSALPRQMTCADPVAVECKYLVDATGHDAVVAGMVSRQGLLEMATTGAMGLDRSEESIVEKTGEIYPGLFAIGMAVSTTFGLPRMGPTFGGMLMSGRRGAEVILKALAQEKVTDVTRQPVATS